MHSEEIVEEIQSDIPDIVAQVRNLECRMDAGCNHENISQATSSSWESVCADCGEVLTELETNSGE